MNLLLKLFKVWDKVVYAPMDITYSARDAIASLQVYEAIVSGKTQFTLPSSLNEVDSEIQSPQTELTGPCQYNLSDIHTRQLYPQMQQRTNAENEIAFYRPGSQYQNCPVELIPFRKQQTGLLNKSVFPYCRGWLLQIKIRRLACYEQNLHSKASCFPVLVLILTP
ncbi:hypothetical protein MP228_000736 [Amoeboaphelidium protococcarum]|nr:hypothetical protein MP228_000736 [Amoeboaphelidium protococcarum]